MTHDIIKIPQYDSTAWFNAIIMAILYSKYSRNLLLKMDTLSYRKEPFAQLLNKLLKKDKSLQINLDTFKLLKPSIDLFKALQLDTSLHHYIYKYSWNSWMFINHFLRYINTSYLIIDYFKNNLYFGIRNNFNLYIHNDKIAFDSYEPFSDSYADKAYKLFIKGNHNPNYICVNVWGTETYNDSYVRFLNIILSKDNVDAKLNIDSHKSIKYNGLKELKDEIVYNNYLYKLDSVILDDYKQVGNNSDFSFNNRYGMVGITNDNDVRNIYNALPRTIKDNEYNLIYLNANKILPCEYMEYSWDQVNQRKKILINKAMCNDRIRTLSSGNDDNVYYFSRGIRTLVYVKQEKIEKSKSKSKSNESREKKERKENKEYRQQLKNQKIQKKNEIELLKNNKRELKAKIKELNEIIVNKKMELLKIKKTLNI